MARLFVVFAVLWPATAMPSSAPASTGPFVSPPLAFERNTGRFDARAKFLARSGASTLFVTPTEAVLFLASRAAGSSSGRVTGPRPRLGSGAAVRAAVLRLSLAGANPAAQVTGLDRQRGIVNYLTGSDPSQWRTGVPTYARLRVADAYPGIDVDYYGASSRPGTSALEYDFVVAPGADPSQIRTLVTGATSIRLAAGDLVVSTAAGDVIMKRPYAYQIVGGKKRPVRCGYSVATAGLRRAGRPASVSFVLGAYDTSIPLVVDPELSYSTFLGGSSNDYASAAATDAAGCAYVTGFTTSPDYPTTAGACDGALAGLDVYVTKLAADGSALVYSTFLGGSDDDYGHGLTVDADGCAYLTGETKSNDFPTTVGAYDASHNGGGAYHLDAFASKLNAAGTALVYSTFLGGAGDDCGWSIALDPSGCAYIGGDTKSTDFPTTAGAFDTGFNAGLVDAVLAKLNASGSGLAYSTYLGGSANETAYRIAVGADSTAYLAGYTTSGNFPVTVGAYQTTHGGGWDVFVARFDATGSALVFSTYLGRSGEEAAWGLAVDSAGSAYATGYTGSSDFPTTPGAWDTSHNGALDVFAAKLDGSGSSMTYSTLVGGGGVERAFGIAVDSSGCAYLSGDTRSTDFPASGDSHDASHNGGIDAFVAKLNAAGSTLAYSTFMGSAGDDYAAGIALDLAACIYVTGYTSSTTFPTTPGAAQESHGGAWDVFVAKLDIRRATSLTAQNAAAVVGDPVVLWATLTDAGTGAPVDGAAVTFRVEGAVVGASSTNPSGVAVIDWIVPDTLGSGDKAIAASFSGDGTRSPSSGSAVLTITKADSTLVVSDVASAVGTTAALTAFLTRSSDGEPISLAEVGFSVDGTGIGVATTDALGMAELDYDVPEGSVGARALDATFAGDDAYNPSSASSTLTVAKADVALSVHDQAAAIGETVVLTARLVRLPGSGPLPGRTVSIGIDGTLVASGTTDEDGVAWLPYAIPESMGIGAHSLNGSFAGDADDNSGTGAGSLDIAQAETLTTAGDAEGAAGDTVTLTAHLMRASDGAALSGRSVRFLVDGAAVGASPTDAHGDAALAYAVTGSLAVGTHTVLATFDGDTAHLNSSGTATLTVTPAATSLYVADRVGAPGDTVLIRGYLRRVWDRVWLPGLWVSFSVDGTSVGGAATDAAGRASVGYPVPNDPGDHTIGASFAGSHDYLASSGSACLTIAPSDTRVYAPDRTGAIASVVALKGYLTRNYDDVRLGGRTLTFAVAGTEVGSGVTDAAGCAAFAYTIPASLGVGAKPIAATFSGDAEYAASSATAVLTVGKAPVYLWMLSRSVVSGLPSYLRGYLRRRPDFAWLSDRTVVFRVDGSVVGSGVTNADGRASVLWTPPAGSVGVHTVRGDFAGDDLYLAGWATGTLTGM